MNGERAKSGMQSRPRWRRVSLALLLFAAGVLPVLATASRHAQSGAQVIAGFFRHHAEVASAWARPRAGENAPGAATNGKAAELLRMHGITSYAVTPAFQDNPGLYQGTVSTAWPAQPSWQGRYRLRLVTEPAATCKILGTTDEAALDDCG
jgi:hypothetical protein